MAKYNYNLVYSLDEADSVREAIQITIFNYMHHQLGWSVDKCEKRVEKELNREIPKSCFNMLEEQKGWKLNNSKILDIGSGQGGAVLEALKRGANAFGIEPGKEFAKLSRMRLKNSGYSSESIIETGAEDLPFEDNYFDYVISLQVLEHVSDPLPILEEIYRVLKPGGECWISCENYLSFQEQHYRVGWLPLLPKWIGSKYLKFIGRDPYFLQNYVYYTTYPQIWSLSNKVGFKNITYEKTCQKVSDKPIKSDHASKRIILNLLSFFPDNFKNRFIKTLLHIRNFMKVGVRVLLKKPEPFLQ